MNDLQGLKSHLKDLETDLMGITVQPRAESAKKITKEGFLKAQQSRESTAAASATGGGSDFLYNLISKPTRKSSRPDTANSVRPASRPALQQSITSSSGSNDSEPIVPRKRSSNTRLDSSLQMELYEMKRKLEQEHERRVAVLQKNLEELRHKRICDKETYKDELARYERDLNELKVLNKNLEEVNMRATHDLEVSESRCRDYKGEIEKLQRDIDRLDQRCLKAGQAVLEMEGKLRGEKQAFDARVLQLESQISDLRESETKLKLREENHNAKTQCLVDEINHLKQQLASEKTVEDKLSDELQRYQKKMDSQVEDYEQLRAAHELRIHELMVELQAERDRLSTIQQDLRTVEQREADAKARLYDRERDSRELQQLKDIHQTVSSERLMLQTQLRAMTDECERQKRELTLATQAQHSAVLRAEDAENENHKLRKKIEALQVQCSKSIVFNAASRMSHPIEDLTDADGVPIAKLRNMTHYKHSPLPASRPVWWFNGGDDTQVLVRRPDPNSLIYSNSAPSNTVAPGPQELSGMQVLTAERRNLVRELAKMPPNPNFRTTEENERWNNVKQQIAQIDTDIHLLQSGC